MQKYLFRGLFVISPFFATWLFFEVISNEPSLNSIPIPKLKRESIIINKTLILVLIRQRQKAQSCRSLFLFLPNIFHKISLKIRFLFGNMFKGSIVNITKLHSWK